MLETHKQQNAIYPYAIFDVSKEATPDMLDYAKRYAQERALSHAELLKKERDTASYTLQLERKGEDNYKLLQGQINSLGQSGLLDDAGMFTEKGWQAYAKSTYSLNMNSLAFFPLHGSQPQEILYANGAAIIKTIEAVGEDGSRIIKRVIDPMSGSGTYANFVRAVGFKGELLINDSEKILMIAQQQITTNPQAVLHEIDHLKRRIRDSANAHGYAFNEDLVYRIPDNDEMADLKEKIDAIRDSKENKMMKDALEKQYKAKAGEYWQALGGRLSEAKMQETQARHPAWLDERRRLTARREELKHFFHTELESSIDRNNGGETIRNDAKTAALYYVMQSNTHGVSDTVHYVAPKERTKHKYAFHLPIGTFTALDVTRARSTSGLRIVALRDTMPSYIDQRQLLTISTLHQQNNPLSSITRKMTHFSNKDGWNLIKEAKAGDFVILSGQFSTKYLTTAQFTQKIKEIIIPASQRGVRVLINNTYKDDIVALEKKLRAMHFNTGVIKGDDPRLLRKMADGTVQDNRQTYLVVTNYDANSPGLDLLPVHSEGS